MAGNIREENQPLKRVDEMQIAKSKKIDSLKALLKEEEPRKLTKVIENIEESYERIDIYISRITGLSTKIITTTRNWHKILKRVIIEEGKEVLDIALEVLEQELIIKEEQKIRDHELKIKGKSKEEKALNRNKDNSIRVAKEIQKPNSNTREKQSVTNNIARKETEKIDTEDIISRELASLNQNLEDKNKTAIRILFKDDPIEKAQLGHNEESPTNLPNTIAQDSHRNVIVYKEECKDLALQTKDIILEDIEDAPLGTSQLEINNTKEYWRKQIDHAVTTYKKPSGSLLEDSV